MKKLLFALFMGASIGVSAQGFNLDSKVTDFELIGVDNAKHTLSGGNDRNKGAIVIFTCNHCPFSKAYEQRIIDLDNKYRSLGYPVIAISSNDPSIEPEDSFEEMQKLAAEKKYPFPYLFDETQEVAKAYGATRTPHVFVVEKVKDAYVLRYRGAIDDNAKPEGEIKKKYVEDAVDALLAKKKVKVKEVKAVGCTIKWKKD